MSWHTSILLIEEQTPSDFGQLLEELGFADCKPNGITDFESATSSSYKDKSVAHVDGWTVLCDGMFFYKVNFAVDTEPPMTNGLWPVPVDKVLCEKTAGGSKALGILLEGASCSYGFTWYKAGVLKRGFLSQESEVVFSEGEPLPAEAELDDDNLESGILHMMSTLCVPFEKLASTDFQVYEYGGDYGLKSLGLT
ncbi:hypothetical protein [Aeoliella mucimassa]|uniref:Uncharacterized protein n=1 Tax=Aeoliella mucimassa TaxID=2527972 RepID=A0A518AHP1_9BACT|nr:hypothetical protein [Aeoliella mucimassa]QDU54230.1 hypothetical protein Pan181_04100 [Aeoliella mucimassa]